MGRSVMAFFTAQAMTRVAKAGYPTPVNVGIGDDPAPAPASDGGIFAPITGLLASQSKVIADPIVAKLQPMIREELTNQVPTFAVYAGLAMGALVLMGIYTGILTTKQRFG